MIFIPARLSRMFAIPDVERMTSAALAVGAKWLVPKITTAIKNVLNITDAFAPK